jgi:protein TonB
VRLVLRAPRATALIPAASGQGLLVSAGLHVAVLAGIAFAAGFRGSPERAEPVYVVSLVSDPGPPGGEPAPAPAAPPSDPAPSPPPPVPALAATAKPNARQAPAPKPAAKTAERPPESPAKPAPEGADGHGGPSAAVGPSSAGPGQAGGIPALGSAAFPFAYYQSIVTGRLRSAWNRPVVPGLMEPIRVTIYFEIQRGGRITGIEAVAASGNAALDRSALRAIHDSNPLPPLPEEFEGDRLAASYTFELTPER